MLDIISQKKKKIIRNALTKSDLISVKVKLTLGTTLFFSLFHYYGKLSFVLFVFTPIKGRK